MFNISVNGVQRELPVVLFSGEPPATTVLNLTMKEFDLFDEMLNIRLPLADFIENRGLGLDFMIKARDSLAKLNLVRDLKPELDRLILENVKKEMARDYSFLFGDIADL